MIDPRITPNFNPISPSSVSRSGPSQDGGVKDGYSVSTSSAEVSITDITAMRQQIASAPLSLASRFESTLGINADQAQQLVTLADQPYRVPYQAGKVESGEVFYVTMQDLDKDPAGFQGYKKMFKVFYGEPGSVQELAVTDARRMQDGGSTTIKTANGPSFSFPVSGDPSVNGCNLSAYLNGEQMSN
jgi:hypothetical protein